MKNNLLITPLFFISLCISFYSFGNNPPFTFYKNIGQWKKEIEYAGSVSGGKIFLMKDAIIYNFYDQQAIADKHFNSSNSALKTSSAPLLDAHALKIHFLNSSTQSLSSIKEHPVNYNFFLGKNKENWASDVSAYEEVKYNELYPGIDLHYYAADGQLKYDFIISPGTDPKVIQIKYTGAQQLYLENNMLYIKTSVNELVENRPYAFQVNESDTLIVPCEYNLKDNILSYSFPDGYNPSLPLIIDPILIFSTYSGSSADNWGNTATYDTLGNLYSGGTVFSFGFPTTLGAYQTSFNGFTDVGILKYDSTGTALHYATYIGGDDTEVPISLVVNNKNELVILGVTGSSDFPVSDNAFQKKFAGGSHTIPLSGINYTHGTDIFISKLSEDGTSLISSTYIGGSRNDGIQNTNDLLVKNYGDELRGDIIFDQDDNLYIASHTYSGDFPGMDTLNNKFNGGEYDGIVCKITDDLSVIYWARYLGGSGTEAVYSIKLDKNNNVYVAGGTTSIDFPVTESALKKSKPDSKDIDGFITSFHADGSGIINSTFIGTGAYDQVYFLDLDMDENVYVLGQTTGPIPIKGNVYFNSNSGQFIQKLDNSLSTLTLSTAFGSGDGRPNISLTAFLVNTCGSIFITGWGGGSNNRSINYIGGSTLNMPVTKDAFQAKTDGSDFYLMVLSEDASKLMYATYFGGNDAAEHVDGGTSRFDKRGIVYQAVCAGCGGNQQYPTTPGAWSDSNNSSNCNNAAFKFDLSTLRAYFDTDIDNGCAPLTVNFTNLSVGGETHTWDFGGDIMETKTDSLSYTFTEPGEYLISLTVEDLKTCIGRDVAYKTITVHETDFNLSPTDSICYGGEIQLSASGGTYYNWSPSVGLSNNRIANPIASPEQTTTYQVLMRNEYGCEHQDSVTIIVKKKMLLDFEIITENDCHDTPIYHFRNISEGVTQFSWNFGDNRQSTDHTPTHEYSNEGIYSVTLSSPNQECVTDKKKTVDVRKFKVPNVFTPNDDIKNETFVIETPENINLSIYNRWGNLLYEKENYNNEWSGTDLASGVYYYEILFENNDVCKGWVHLIK
ncbi:MAG: gliding motility-associated C-terminal domain-containing protein [Candidatus Cyclobacteriaceae bacterium M2_1C_046]